MPCCCPKTATVCFSNITASTACPAQEDSVQLPFVPQVLNLAALLQHHSGVRAFARTPLADLITVSQGLTTTALSLSVRSTSHLDAGCKLVLLRPLKVCCGSIQFSVLLCLSATEQQGLTIFLKYTGQLKEPTDSDVLTHKHDIRNIAIIAHVDHGKTTLVSCFFCLLLSLWTFLEQNHRIKALLMSHAGGLYAQAEQSL